MRKYIFGLIVLITLSFSQDNFLRNIYYEELLEKVRITLSCDTFCEFQTFLNLSPPAINIILFGVKSSVKETMEVAKFGIKDVLIKENEEWIKININLEAPYAYNVFRQNSLIVLELSKETVSPPTEKKMVERTVSLEVKDADIIDVLRMLSRLGNINIIASPEVKGTVTMRFDNVPFSVAFSAILRAVECNAVEISEGVIMVKPFKKDVEGELHTRVYNLNYAEASDIKKVVDKFLSSKGRAEAVEKKVGEGGGSKRSSYLIITDVPEKLADIEKLIGEIDKPAPQISIEAKFIETTISSDKIYGIDWSIRAAATATVPDIGEEIAIPIMFKHLIIGKLSFAQMSAALELLQSEGKAKLLANPHTLTMDNQKATVEMVTKVPLLEVRVDPETRERVYTWRERSIGIMLTVSPHLTKDGNITMEIEPKVEAIIGWRTAGEQEVPIIATREGKTQVAAKDGEVIVIGGLKREQETRAETKIPILGSIPILGKLFTRTSIRKEESELLIFIIPRVIESQG
ncbi:MAG: secretin N-terminal domain-containing protein [candidate division WOR-3 bacterium]